MANGAYGCAWEEHPVVKFGAPLLPKFSLLRVGNVKHSQPAACTFGARNMKPPYPCPAAVLLEIDAHLHDRESANCNVNRQQDISATQ